MNHRLAATTVSATVGVVAVVGAILLWPASEERVRIEALASEDPDEVRRAADWLATSGAASSGSASSSARARPAGEGGTSTDPDEVPRAADPLASGRASSESLSPGSATSAADPQTAVEALRQTRDRLVGQLIEQGNRDLKQFGHLDFDRMVRRISDRRQSSQARRLWRALGSVTRAIAALDPASPEARTSEREDWEPRWEPPVPGEPEEFAGDDGGDDEELPPDGSELDPAGNLQPAEVEGDPEARPAEEVDPPSRPENESEGRVTDSGASDLPASGSREAESAR